MATQLREIEVEMLRERDATVALTEDGAKLEAFPYREGDRSRIFQVARYRGVDGYPEHPADVLDDWEFGRAMGQRVT